MGCGIVSSFVQSIGGLTPGVNVLEDVSKDYVGAGVSVKSIPLTKGLRVIQHKHDYDHLSILMSGKVTLMNDDERHEMDATEGPVSIVVRAGAYHSLFAHEDSLWLCVHREGVQ